MEYLLRKVTRDGIEVTKLKCPKCGKWCDIDDDQYTGKISIWHDVQECGFHETIDLSNSKNVRWDLWWRPSQPEKNKE